APYKTNVYAMTPGGYVALDAKGLTAAGGRYEMEKSQLDAYRAVVAADRPGAELERIVSALESAGYEIGGEELKRMPPGVPPGLPAASLGVRIPQSTVAAPLSQPMRQMAQTAKTVLQRLSAADMAEKSSRRGRGSTSIVRSRATTTSQATSSRMPRPNAAQGA